MKRVFGWALLALFVSTLISIGGTMWRSMDFDSKFSGYVQNAVRVSPVEIERRIREIAAESGVSIIPGTLLILPRGDAYEVSCRYPVRLGLPSWLGLGGISYVWNKEVIARTRLGGLASSQWEAHPA